MRTLATTSAAALLGVALLAGATNAGSVAPHLDDRDVDEAYPYTGPVVPVGDWVDPTINGNGKGFKRLVEPPAVQPASKNPTNNVNVIALSYVPKGVNIHYQTPFGLGAEPLVKWGSDASNLNKMAHGSSHRY